MTAMAEGSQEARPNRRSMPRFPVDEEASLLLLSHGTRVACRILDISQGGCRLFMQERYKAGTMVRVEIGFRVRGLAFRFSGVTQWTDHNHLVGIRFVGVAPRRIEELAEALSELESELAAKAAKENTAETSPNQDSALSVRPDDTGSIASEQRAEEGTVAAAGQAQSGSASYLDSLRSRPFAFSWQKRPTADPAVASAESRPAAAPSPAPQPVARNRRNQERHSVDTTATLYLVKIASKLTGKILDLSMSGCRIRTDERFPVGIYTRIEIEFQLEGLPFRLGGVVQSIHDRNHIGIRFLDMSPRKSEQVEQLIEEIKQMYGETHSEKQWTDKSEPAPPDQAG